MGVPYMYNVLGQVGVREGAYVKVRRQGVVDDA